jgi:oligoribonuclease NrnB/cAMP/cGMP phosphodiesterase (DHH superfamily)
VTIDVKDRKVIMLDFAPKLRDMEFWKTTKALVIIDHHKTATEDLADVPRFEGGAVNAASALSDAVKLDKPAIVAMFDMAESGASLTWRYLYGSYEAMPRMVELVKDRDLWQWKFGEDTRCFSAYARSLEKTWANWDGLFDSTREAIRMGEPIVRAERQVMESLAKQAYDFQFDVFNGGLGEVQTIIVPVVNAPYHYASDLANYLLQINPDAAFAACWYRRADGKLSWSLRSADDRYDASQIAKAMGGGGHRNACGFECTPDDADEDWITCDIKDHEIAERYIHVFEDEDEVLTIATEAEDTHASQ